MTGTQLKAMQAVLDVKQEDLAGLLDISKRSLVTYQEFGSKQLPIKVTTLAVERLTPEQWNAVQTLVEIWNG